TVGKLESAGVTVTVCGLDDPRLSVVLPTPLAPVVLCAALTPPPPAVTSQLTTTPGTGRLLASSALTLSGAGSGLSKYQLWASPAFFTSCVGGPGGSVPPPPPPPPPRPRKPPCRAPHPRPFT